MTKRLKISDTLKWKPILSNDYSILKFNLKKFIIADVSDSKNLSYLVTKLQNVYPLLNDVNKYKRVRKLDNNKFEVLVCEKDDYKGFSDDMYSHLLNVRELDLPIDKILTKKQFDLVSKSYWPMAFHMNKHIESLLDQSYFTKNESMCLKIDYYARLVVELALYFRSKSAALIVNPKNDNLIGCGIDSREDHPLRHSIIDALDNVAARQAIELGNNINIEKYNCHNENLKKFIKEKYDENNSKYENLKNNFEKSLDKSDYLCTNYDVFLTHEPCSMCAMALIHSRVSRVFYIFNTKYGYLNTKCKMHCVSNLNHSFEVFEAVDFYSDSMFSDYFTKPDTSHINYLEIKNDLN